MSELGELTRCYTIAFERRSKHPSERLWRAITDPGRVSKWMQYPARIDLRVGGDYFVDFSRTSPENLDGVIVRVEPERTLAYVWGVSVVEWKLEPDGSGCRYTFVHHGMPRRDVDDEEGVAAGWHLWLDDLESVLDGATPGPEDPGVYAELSVPYRERLAEVMGPR